MSEEKQIESCENCLHYSACLINSEYVPTPCRAYEDKAGYRKQNGNTMDLPCKPGQTLWFPSKYYGSPFPIYITHLEIYEEETIIYSDGGSEWQIEDIGKTIFLTKEEAEQALVKMGCGEE